MFTSRYFKLGKLVVTRAVYDSLQKSERFAVEIYLALKRYCVMDWGKVTAEGRELNNIAVTGKKRIFAVYGTCIGNIWVITEADRSATTVLLPEDY